VGLWTSTLVGLLWQPRSGARDVWWWTTVHADIDIGRVDPVCGSPSGVAASDADGEISERDYDEYDWWRAAIYDGWPESAVAAARCGSDGYACYT